MDMKQNMKRRQTGFTLIEVMVVVVILGILAAVVVTKVADRPDEAKLVKVKQDLLTLESALNLYKLDNDIYPTSEEGLEALVTKPADARNWKQGGYIARLQKDPWNTPYQYLSPGENSQIDIYSFGADKQPGGEGINADIGNWSK